MNKIKLNDHIIEHGCSPFIIAEAGVNHNGKFNIAKKLIINAKTAGANAIKFQIFNSYI